MDELNLFCREQGLPADLQVRLRQYFRSTLPFQRTKRYDRLLDRMSTRLRGDSADAGKSPASGRSTRL